MRKRSEVLAEALRELRESHLTIASSKPRPHRLWIPAAVAAAAALVFFVVRPPGREGAFRTEILTSFVDLPAGAALPAATMTTILRVEMRKEDLRQYGLTVPAAVGAELVRADLMVGEDGLARAVRFVQ